MSRLIAAPVPAAPLLLAAAGAVPVAPLRRELIVELPVLLLLVAVVFPGPTKKKVAPRRVRLPVSSTNVVRLKFSRFAGTVPLVTLTVVEA